MPAVAERVDRLEDLMAQLLETTAQTSRELREFKEEMRASAARFEQDMRASAARSERFEKEMCEFKDEMREFKDEMREFKNEMHEFKEEMQAYRKQSHREQIEFRKHLGDITNNMGRLVEDAVAPGIPKIFRDITKIDPKQIEFQAIRCKKNQPNSREFDAVIVSRDYVLINETKSTMRPEYVKDFHTVMRDQIRLFFPEYKDKKFIGVVSSLYVDESIIALGSRLGLYVLGFGEELMDVLNPSDFSPQYF